MLKKSHLFIMLIIATPVLAGENWPCWRGPRNDGTSTETNLPAQWGATQNIKWRVALPGPAPSTPIIWSDRIFLTSAEDNALVFMCLDTNGKILWKKTLGEGNYEIRGDESNAASPTPSTDGEHVWVKLGTGLLACFDFSGNEVWRVDLHARYKPFNMYFGMSSSPLLEGDQLYLQLLHTDAQLVLALDKTTGKEVWKHERASDASMESLHSYATPFLYRFDGQEFLLVHGADFISAHDLKDGRELWRSGGLNSGLVYNPFYRFVASPVASAGLIVAPSAKNGPVLGINPVGAKGDITSAKAQFHWKLNENTPDVPSPLIHDGLVYLCRENGVLLCLDAKTGAQYYMERTHNMRHRASPVYADGKIYLLAADGTTTVVKAGKKFEMLATNSIPERASASLAIANGVIYLRTFKALYAIAQQ